MTHQDVAMLQNALQNTAAMAQRSNEFDTTNKRELERLALAKQMQNMQESREKSMEPFYASRAKYYEGKNDESEKASKSREDIANAQIKGKLAIEQAKQASQHMKEFVQTLRSGVIEHQKDPSKGFSQQDAVKTFQVSIDSLPEESQAPLKNNPNFHALYSGKIDFSTIPSNAKSVGSFDPNKDMTDSEKNMATSLSKRLEGIDKSTQQNAKLLSASQVKNDPSGIAMATANARTLRNQRQLIQADLDSILKKAPKPATTPVIPEQTNPINDTLGDQPEEDTSAAEDDSLNPLLSAQQPQTAAQTNFQSPVPQSKYPLGHKVKTAKGVFSYGGDNVGWIPETQ